jgi:hypothetical protein
MRKYYFNNLCKFIKIRKIFKKERMDFILYDVQVM